MGALIAPTSVGQQVRFRGYGGEVLMGHETGVVVRFNRNGKPVIRARHPHRQIDTEITDRYGCAAVVNDDGTWLRPDRVAS